MDLINFLKVVEFDVCKFLTFHLGAVLFKSVEKDFLIRDLIEKRKKVNFRFFEKKIKKISFLEKMEVESQVLFHQSKFEPRTTTTKPDLTPLIIIALLE